jgi:hypothetical protein
MLSDTTFIELVRPECQGRRKDASSPEEAAFTPVSQNSLVLPESVKFASDLNTTLWSVREAAASGIETKLAGSEYLATRTAGIYLKDVGGKYFVALDDTPHPEQNIILARAQEGHFAHISSKNWLLPRKDYFVKQILNRADKQDRIVEVNEKPYELVMGTPNFGDDRLARALFGNMTKRCENLLQARGYSKLIVYLARPEVLEQRAIGHDNVEVRFTGINVDYKKQSYNIVANYPFYFGGISCGIWGAREFKKA